MDLNLLTVFVNVIEQESLSGAARKLDMPVSSISRAITRLEEELETQLLMRTTRRVTQTTAGAELYQRVAPLVASLTSEVEQLVEKEERPTGELKITAPVELGPTVLADIVARFRARFPEVTVHAHLTNQVVDLAKEGIDLALRFSGPRLKDSTLVAKRAAALVGHVYAAPTYLARKGTPRTGTDLKDHDWVIFSPLREVTLTCSDGSRIDVRPRGKVSGTEILYTRQLIRAGLGMGFLPAHLAEDDVEAGVLVRVLPKSVVQTGYLWVVRPSARHVPAKVEAFRDFVLEYLRLHPLGGEPGQLNP